MKNIKMKFLIPAFLVLIFVSSLHLFYLVRDMQCIMQPAKLLQGNLDTQWNFLVFLSGSTVIAVFGLYIGLLYSRRECRMFGYNSLPYLAMLTVIDLFMILVETSKITKKTSEESMFFALKEYGEYYPSTMRMDFFQTSFQCCGVYNYTDWKLNYRYNCSEANKDLCKFVPETCKQKPSRTFQVSSFCSTPILRAVAIESLDSHNISEYQGVKDVIYTTGCLEYYLAYRTYFLGWSIMYILTLFLIQVYGISIDYIYRKYIINIILRKEPKSQDLELNVLDTRRRLLRPNRQVGSPDDLEEDYYAEDGASYEEIEVRDEATDGPYEVTEQPYEETDEEYEDIDEKYEAIEELYKELEEQYEEIGAKGDSTSEQRDKGLVGRKAKVNSNEQENNLPSCSNTNFSKSAIETYTPIKYIFENGKIIKIDVDREKRRKIPESEESEDDDFLDAIDDEEYAEQLEDYEMVQAACENEKTAEKLEDKEEQHEARETKQWGACKFRRSI